MIKLTIKNGMAYSLIFLLIIACSSCIFNKYSKNPATSPFITFDIEQFWRAFKIYQNNPTENPFYKHYLAQGSNGLGDFIPNRIISADHLWKTVQEKEEEYLKIKANSLKVIEQEAACRKAFQKLKEWYPDARFPPVYFVIGRFTSGGTQSNNGLLIGAEMLEKLEHVPHIVAHELVHFQQKTESRFKPNLLEACIMEGSADFIGELTSGKHINQKIYEYGEANKAALCKEFVASMNMPDYEDWLYSTCNKDQRPNDLGYWIGYQITKTYFDKAPDKKLAIREILNLQDANLFLKKSGYLDAYLE